jgi:type II secretory pathway component PulC
MPARITDIFPLLLITLLCVGIVEGGYQALEYFVLRTPVEQVEKPDTVTVEKNLIVKDDQKKQQDYRVILQRNLFGPPPGIGEPTATVDPDYTENLKSTSLNIILMGTINGGEGVARAIILDKQSNKQALYEKGDTIQGASVKEILRGKVILVYNGKDEMLDMSEAAKVRPAYAVPVAKAGARKKRSPIVRGSKAGGKNRLYSPSVSPRGTPRRVINRPRAIRPSRSIRKD